MRAPPPKGRVPIIRMGAACSLQQPAAACSSLQQPTAAACRLQPAAAAECIAPSRLQAAVCRLPLQPAAARSNTSCSSNVIHVICVIRTICTIIFKMSITCTYDTYKHTTCPILRKICITCTYNTYNTYNIYDTVYNMHNMCDKRYCT